MKLAFLVAAAMLFLPGALAQAADVPAQLSTARQRIEMTDSRASGRLVQVDAGGNRVSHAIVIKAHWFPGVLRILVEIVPSKTPAENAHQDGRATILLEMRPSGQDTVRVFYPDESAHPHRSTAVSLPFDKWSSSISGTNFDYEDFLQAEYYWQGQTILKSARLGTHDCDVLKSTPGATAHSHYSEVQTWLDKAMAYPIYTEKTLKDSGRVKEFTSLGFTQSGGVWAARQVEVKVQNEPGSSLLIIEHGSTKAKLTLKDFSPEQISKFEDHSQDHSENNPQDR